MIRRWNAPDEALLRRILADPPRALGTARSQFFREVYFDTSAGDLRQRGARCRLRFEARGDRVLTVWVPDAGRIQSRVREADAAAALSGTSSAARQLRVLCDPARLNPWIERDVERIARTGRVPVVGLPLFDLVGDLITARRGDLTTRLAELAILARPWGGVAADQLARVLDTTSALRAAGNDALRRAQAGLDAVEGESMARELRGEREVALIAVEHGRIGLFPSGPELRLPVQQGSGENACRAALRQLVGSGEGQLRLLGVVPRSGDRVPLEVWTVRRVHRASGNGGGSTELQWFSPAELIARVGSPLLRHPSTLAALTVAARSPLLPEWSGAPFGEAEAAESDRTTDERERVSRVTLTELRAAVQSDDSKDPARETPDQFLNPELSWIEFNGRVLALAEHHTTPVAARLRFLGIFSSNLDQFVMTKVGALKQLVAAGRNARAPQSGGLRPQETLDAIAVRLRPLIDRQYRAYHALARAFRIQRWEALSGDVQARLRSRCADEVLPFVSPKALTRAPGHPFPLVGDRRLALLVALRDREKSPPHYAIVEFSAELPRFLALPDDAGFILLEDLVRPNLDLLFPGRIVAGAHVFRLTRSGDLQLDETTTANFLQALEEELAQRAHQPVLRIELEATTPQALSDLLQRELRFEESDRDSTLSPADVYVADGPVDLGGLQELAGASGQPDYPPFTPEPVFAPDRPIAEQLDEHDVLVYHPDDSFPGSVERFISEAADDPDVQAIKLTLYRLGSGGGASSPIPDALRRAAAVGKDVSVLVELKARFDEARNIAWARSLERDGIHVVTGLVSLKTHAKLALVVRRGVDGRVRRYAHIGSGNYNRATALHYTDVGLFTADPALTSDVHALFNELTGSSQAPQLRLRHLLVAPTDLLERLLALIAREGEHARAGRPARIRAKLNALSDSTIIQALYAASRDGVDIDLVVRGICTLRPGVPGLSERIRVVSLLGRFLEHARVYHFSNGNEGHGSDEYYIGSADWRPRNLRRRVEVICPVYDPVARIKLDSLLTTQLASPEGWRLRADGGYEDPQTG